MLHPNPFTQAEGGVHEDVVASRLLEFARAIDEGLALAAEGGEEGRSNYVLKSPTVASDS